MKVLHIISDLSGGGGGACLLHFAIQANRVIDQEHHILTFGKVFRDEIDVPSDITVHESNSDFRDAIRFVQRGKYDVLQWHWWEEMPLIKQLADFKGPKRIIGCDVYPSEQRHTLGSFEINYADMIVCDGLDTYKAYKDIPEHKIRFIVGGGPLFPYIQKNSVRCHNRIGRGSVLTQKKCPGDMVESFAKMNVDADFYVYGEGPLRGKFGEDAKRLGIGNKVHMEGWKKDYPSYVSQLDLFVYELPANSYASSELVLQGAMAARVPVVIFPSNGTRWMFEHNKTALVANSRQELIEYTEQLWHNPARANELADNAFYKAWHDYGTHNMVKGYLSTYIGLLKCRQ